MADDRALEILRQGAERWNEWRAGQQSSRELLARRWKIPNIVPDLSGAELVGASLIGVDLSKIDLRNADLRNANLEFADLSGTQLGGAQLVGANLNGAFLTRANFEGTNAATATFVAAHLEGAIIRRASLYACNLIEADLQAAEIVDTDLESAVLVKAIVEGSTFENCFVYGISAWDLQGRPRIQQHLQVTPRNEPPLIVDKLVVAQFMYLLLGSDSLRETLDCITRRGVLLLGRFGEGGLAVLRTLSDGLRDLGYLPFLFDFERPRERNYTEMIKTLVGLSRFVIVDVSGPSVPQELYATVPHFKLPFIPILENQRTAYALLADLLEYDWVNKPVIRYNASDALAAVLLPQIMDAAERLSQKRDQLRKALFESGT